LIVIAVLRSLHRNISFYPADVETCMQTNIGLQRQIRRNIPVDVIKCDRVDDSGLCAKSSAVCYSVLVLMAGSVFLSQSHCNVSAVVLPFSPSLSVPFRNE